MEWSVINFMILVQAGAQVWVLALIIFFFAMIFPLRNQALEFTVRSFRQAARRSWVLRGVSHGFSEEARTRGFASLAFAKFAFSAQKFSPMAGKGQSWDVRRKSGVAVFS
jgi:hypothetical protein